MSKKIYGVLEDFFETGTEGVIWSIYEDGKTGYDALNVIEDGDKLTVLGVDGTVLWEGVIEEDHDTGWQPYGWVTRPHQNTIFCGKSKTCAKGHTVAWAKRRNLGQQVSCGRWVHWIQKGVDAGDWGRMFFLKPAYKAILVKKKK